MQSKAYFNFLATLFMSNLHKHLWVFFISSLLIMILASFLFVKSSIENEVFKNLKTQPDFIVQKFRAGNLQDMPQEWGKTFKNIDGVESLNERVYGQHFYEPLESHFMIVGMDFKDAKVCEKIKKLIPSFNQENFLSKPNMLLGSGAKTLFDYYEYKDKYTFRPPDRSKKKVFFYANLPTSSQFYTNDMIIMDKAVAKRILGIQNGYTTDMEIRVKSDADLEAVKTALILSHFDMRIIAKPELIKYYKNMFNYKGGVFMVLYIVSLLTFALILYQRYSNIVTEDVKEIAVFRMIGWKISDIMYLKLSENFIVAIFSYLGGIVLAYFYVFVLNAPLIRNIFLGYENLQNNVHFSPSLELSNLVLIFFLFVIPFMLVILIPIYKISASEPIEVLR